MMENAKAALRRHNLTGVPAGRWRRDVGVVASLFCKDASTTSTSRRSKLFCPLYSSPSSHLLLTPFQDPVLFSQQTNTCRCSAGGMEMDQVRFVICILPLCLSLSLYSKMIIFSQLWENENNFFIFDSKNNLVDFFFGGKYLFLIGF